MPPPVPRCNAGHRLPDVVGYVYPDGRVFCPGCQTWDASAFGGSPAGTVSLVREASYRRPGFRLGDLPYRELPEGSACAVCDVPLPTPCQYCEREEDPEAVDAARLRRRDLVMAASTRPRYHPSGG